MGEVNLLDRGQMGRPSTFTLKLNQVHNSGGAWISSFFSEIKLPARPSCSIVVGENNCLDQGTVLLHRGDDKAGENILFWAPVESPGATEPIRSIHDVSFFSGLSCF